MLLIKNAELHAYCKQQMLADVRCRNGVITQIGKSLLPERNETLLDARGGALLPGLHDHHMHLLALAATRASINCSPDHVRNCQELQQGLQNAEGQGWIRAIHYHESIAGDLDRWQLDQLLPDRPLRLQHRSGILWMLNSKAIALLDIEREQGDGIERDEKGRVTGRLFRRDHWLRQRLGNSAAPGLGRVSQELAAYGITGITDTGADNEASTLLLLEQAAGQAQLRQKVVLMGNEYLPLATHPGFQRGALKILLDEFSLPETDTLLQRMAIARQQQRPVAFHCVTEAQLVFALSILQQAGNATGDRIEHASLCPDDVLPLLKSSGVAVVTQPGLLSGRGLQYQTDVPISQHCILYRCRTFLNSGITLALSSDAPYGEINPWENMLAACERRNSDGYVLGEREKLSPEQALQAYLADPLDLARQRLVGIGASADLCLLHLPWRHAREQLSASLVAATLVDGEIVYKNPDCKDAVAPS